MGIAPTQVPSSSNIPAIAAAASLPSSEASTVLSSDFETFLKMLTAQAEYQDPLEPIDSSEYAAQLAQFSMVEQQVLANDRLAELTAQMSISNMTQIASLIGMEARTTKPVYFNGSSLTVDAEPPDGADQAFLIVTNEQGFAVQRRQIPISDDPISWNGRGDDGVMLEEGYYSFELESLSEGEVILTEPASTFTKITEARSVDGQAAVVLDGRTVLLATDLNGMRDDT